MIGLIALSRRIAAAMFALIVSQPPQPLLAPAAKGIYISIMGSSYNLET